MLRNRIENNTELMIENIIRASINEVRIRNKYYREVIIIIAIIEYNVRMITNKNIIKSKRIEVFLKRLIEIKKMTYGCMNF